MSHVYKVRDRFTGLFLCAGINNPKWSKKGKVWSTLGALRCAFAHPDKKKPVPPSWEIVVLDVVGHINCDIVINTKKLSEKQVLEMIKPKKSNDVA